MLYIANDCYDDNDTIALYQFSEAINTDIRSLHAVEKDVWSGGKKFFTAISATEIR